MASFERPQGAGLAVDCHDPETLAAFWCEVLDFKVIDRSEGKVEIGSWVPTVEEVRARQMPPTLLFIQVPEGKTVKNRVHLDVSPIDGCRPRGQRVSAAARLVNLVGALAVGCAELQVERMRQQTGLDEAALGALLAVDARPGCTVGDIAKTTGLSHSGAVRSIDRLTRGHLVTRVVRAEDRRTVELRCTSNGAAMADRALATRRQALTALVDVALPADPDRRSLERLVELLLRSLPKTERADAWRICRLCEHAVCRGDNCPVGRSVP